MKYPKYPAYKDSGVEWIGKIPEHWDTVPIKFIMSCNDETLPEGTHPETKIQYIEISDVSEIKGITNIQEIKFSDAPSRARRIVKDGDIIISTVRTYLRAIGAIKEPKKNTVVSTGFAVLRPRGISSKFAKYAFSSSYFIERIVSESTGVNYPAISSEKLMNFSIPIPDSKSQSEISDYIDKIESKLNLLISKQEKMIGLLKEKRQAIITKAVTKGFYRSVRMKDSGVDWIGEIPEGWIVTKLKFISFISADYGINLSSDNYID